MKALLDTSVLVSRSAPAGIEDAASVVSITELHLGVLVARRRTSEHDASVADPPPDQ